jgi:hypothetical protein
MTKDKGKNNNGERNEDGGDSDSVPPDTVHRKIEGLGELKPDSDSGNDGNSESTDDED